MVRQRVVFVFERDTKNHVRYQEVAEPGKDESSHVIGHFYVKKWALRKAGAQGWPKMLTVVVEDFVGSDKAHSR